MGEKTVVIMGDDEVVGAHPIEGAPSIEYTTPSSWAVVKLPEFILLKGDNGKYLKVGEGENASVFTGDKKMDGTILEVVPLSDGSVGIKSTWHGRFLVSDLRLGVVTAHTVYTTPAEVESDWTCRFWPVNIGRGTERLIGLRLFMTRGIELRCYNAGPNLMAKLTPSAKNTGFEVEEAVSQRQIYGVTYHMDQAKISEHEPLTSVTKDIKNWSKTPQKGVLSFSHTERESHSWGSTDSVKMSMSVEMSVKIPFVGGGPNIKTEAYFAGSYEWGEEQGTSKQIGTQLEVEVPAMTMVQATMIVQKGKLEVPFSYTQRDTVYNGYTTLTNLPDGLFSGVNTYVTYETINKSLA